MRINTYLIVGVLFIGFFLLGFIRDELFVNANYWLGYKRSYNPEYLNNLKYAFLFKRWSYYTLYYAKFGLTLLFSILYWILTLSVIWVIFRSKLYLILASWLYLALFLLSIMVYISGYFIFNIYETYEFSRFIAGIIQSPTACMLIFLAFRLHRQNEINSKT